MMFHFLLGMMLGAAGAADLPGKPRPFVTDGCTAWIEGPRRNPDQWRHCCVLHDLAFWAGAAGQRPRADLDLRDCVAATGARGQARLMYFGIRAGSRSPRKIAGMQWGNAWSATESRRSPLTPAEVDLLEAELMDTRYDPVIDVDLRASFLRELREITSQP